MSATKLSEVEWELSVIAAVEKMPPGAVELAIDIMEARFPNENLRLGQALDVASRFIVASLRPQTTVAELMAICAEVGGSVLFALDVEAHPQATK